MKKIICLLLVVLMVGALLVACGETEQPPIGGTTDNGNNGNNGNNGGGDPIVPPPVTPPVTTKNWWDDLDFSGKTITLQLSNVDEQELPCGHQKYMQGPESLLESEEGFEKVQNEVLKRNEAVKKALKLDQETGVRYIYIAEDWGAGISGKIQDAESLGPGKTPDMYSDQLYDMMGLSFQHGIFSNIMKYTQDNKNRVEGWKEGAGYFKINKANGYNKGLMDNLSLTPENKMFLIASDYYVDVMRAMVVMPFNLAMYGGYAVTDDPNAEKLYRVVLDDKWTWDQLLSYANVYSGTGKASIDDERMLMALSVGGLSGSAIVYSSAFKCYTYSNGAYTLTEDCPEITNAFQEIAKVAADVSVACGEDTYGLPTGVANCREVFTSGRALFAGPQLLGIVEDSSYTKMEKLSIVPVPKNSIRSTHNTAINTRARVGAVSFNTTQKDVISAWIQLSTENSNVVKKEYFDKAMNNKYLAGSGASAMLDFIYNNVGDNKSLVLDNMILYKDWDMKMYTWSNMIQEGYYQGHKTDIHSVYKSAVEMKQSTLDKIMEDWATADAITP